MTTVGWLPAGVEDLFGAQATAEEAYEVLTVDVPSDAWIPALETARDRLGCTFFDWLSAVDEPGTGFRVTAHVAALSPVRRLLLRTTVPHESPRPAVGRGRLRGRGLARARDPRDVRRRLHRTPRPRPPAAAGELRGASAAQGLRPRGPGRQGVARRQGAGESEHGGPKRRQMLPPGVPDPNEWGPLRASSRPPRPAPPAARPPRGPAPRANARPAAPAPSPRARRARRRGRRVRARARAPVRAVTRVRPRRR